MQPIGNLKRIVGKERNEYFIRAGVGTMETNREAWRTSTSSKGGGQSWPVGRKTGGHYNYRRT